METILRRERLIVGGCLAVMVLAAWWYLFHTRAAMSAMDMPAMDMRGMNMRGMNMPGMDMSGEDNHGAGGPSPRHGMEFCPYTAVAAAMAAGHAPLLTAFTRFVPSRVVFPPERSIPRGTIVPTRLPRGPPASA